MRVSMIDIIRDVSLTTLILFHMYSSYSTEYCTRNHTVTVCNYIISGEISNFYNCINYVRASVPMRDLCHTLYGKTNIINTILKKIYFLLRG